MNILGISAYYHDSAACLVRDGDIVETGDSNGTGVAANDELGRCPCTAFDKDVRDVEVDIVDR